MSGFAKNSVNKALYGRLNHVNKFYLNFTQSGCRFNKPACGGSTAGTGSCCFMVEPAELYVQVEQSAFFSSLTVFSSLCVSPIFQSLLQQTPHNSLQMQRNRVELNRERCRAQSFLTLEFESLTCDDKTQNVALKDKSFIQLRIKFIYFRFIYLCKEIWYFGFLIKGIKVMLFISILQAGISYSFRFFSSVEICLRICLSLERSWLCLNIQNNLVHCEWTLYYFLKPSYYMQMLLQFIFCLCLI